MAAHWRRLGELIRADQEQLYGTQQEFADAAGVSLRTVESLLSGQPANYRTRTVADVEAALEWEPGSIQRVLEGGRPRRSPHPELARVARAWPRLSDRDRRLILALVGAMLSD